MNWDVSDVAEEFKLFKQGMELCLTDNEIEDAEKKSVKIQIAVAGLAKSSARTPGTTSLKCRATGTCLGKARRATSLTSL